MNRRPARVALRKPPMSRTLRLEALEDRRMLSVFTVNDTADTVDAHPGDGLALDASGRTTLRAAIMEANAHAGDDTIHLPAGTYTLSRVGSVEDACETGDLDITDATGRLTILGAGDDATIIDANRVEVEVEQFDRIFDVHSDADLSLSGLTISNGCVYGHDGGGIRNSGRLTITDSTISGNWCFGNGGGICSEGGVSTITGSTISGNMAASDQLWDLKGNGGGIFSSGDLVVADCEISSNTASDSGGGVCVDTDWLAAKELRFDEYEHYQIKEKEPFVLYLTGYDPSLYDFRHDHPWVSGMHLDEDLGIFHWTPSEDQDRVDMSVGVWVELLGWTPAYFSFSVEVLETNSKPTIMDVDPRIAAPGDLVAVTFEATDEDNEWDSEEQTILVDTLTFSLGDGAPDAASIDPATGEFRWATTAETQPGVFDIEVIVSDDGEPPMSASTIFRVAVSDGTPIGQVEDEAPPSADEPYHPEIVDGRSVLVDVTITGNTANAGGGIANDGVADVIGALLVENFAEFGGGIFNQGDLTVTNSTVAGNETIEDVGIRVWAGVLTLENSIVATNLADHPGADLYVDSRGVLLGYHNLIGDGLGQPLLDGVDGNVIGVDPMFLNPAAGDYRLQPDSPAIDAGDNALADYPLFTAIDFDLAGQPRIVDGDRDGRHTVDLGAYEYTQSITLDGTPEADQITIEIEGDRVVAWVNSEEYAIHRQNLWGLEIDGLGGGDAVTVIGSDADESVLLSPGRMEFLDDTGLAIDVTDVASIAVDAGGGDDRVKLLDSPGDDRLWMNGRSVTMQGPDYDNTADGFRSASANAHRGGFDRAAFLDTDHDETFHSIPGTAFMACDDYFDIAQGFEEVDAWMTVGVDSVRLYGSHWDDMIWTSEQAAAIESPRARSATTVRGYDSIEIDARGGWDRILITDSSQDDVFTHDAETGDTTVAFASSPASPYLTARGIERTSMFAIHDGSNEDQLNLHDTALDDLLEVDANAVHLYVDTNPAIHEEAYRLVAQAYYFDRITLHGDRGGVNKLDERTDEEQRLFDLMYSADEWPG